MASLRQQIQIDRPTADVWRVVGRPELLHLWFPGIVACTVDGNTRVITTGTGVPMPEQIVTNDSLQHRFQYSIRAPIFRHHLGTIDVIELGDDSCLVVYSTDADPSVMALVISGGTRGALEELKRQFDAGAGPALTAADDSETIESGKGRG